MSGPANPEAAWRSLALHQEAMHLQSIIIRLSLQQPAAAEIAIPRINAEVQKERRTKWLNNRTPKTPASTSSCASAQHTKKARQTV